MAALTYLVKVMLRGKHHLFKWFKYLLLPSPIADVSALLCMFGNELWAGRAGRAEPHVGQGSGSPSQGCTWVALLCSFIQAGFVASSVLQSTDVGDEQIVLLFPCLVFSHFCVVINLCPALLKLCLCLLCSLWLPMISFKSPRSIPSGPRNLAACMASKSWFFFFLWVLVERSQFMAKKIKSLNQKSWKKYNNGNSAKEVLLVGLKNLMTSWKREIWKGNSILLSIEES